MKLSNSAPAAETDHACSCLTMRCVLGSSVHLNRCDAMVREGRRQFLLICSLGWRGERGDQGGARDAAALTLRGLYMGEHMGARGA